MSPKSKWITVINKPAVVKMSMFIFPYAGGSAQTFKRWAPLFPTTTQVFAIQLPGRASRFTEPLLESIEDVLDALQPEIKPFLQRPFAFFGHSMGAAISFELARLLEQEGIQPLHLFVSGRSGPTRPHEREDYHSLPDSEFRVKMRELNGTPPEILEHEELMDLMVPIVRSDFAISETYTFKPGYTLTCPLTAFGGVADPDVPEESVADWERHSNGSTAYHMMPGDHFFLHECSEAIVQKMVQYLAPHA